MSSAISDRLQPLDYLCKSTVALRALATLPLPSRLPKAKGGVCPFLSFLLLCGIVLCGCKKEVSRGLIAGTVTFQGQAVSEGVVLLRDITQGINMTANLKPDGTYTIIMAKGAGLPTGTYQACVCPPVTRIITGKPPETPMPCPNIPQKYRNFKTAGLQTIVQEGENRFDIAM